MVKVNLGNKWECVSCGAKFYDLGRPSALCPKCGTDQQDPEAIAEAAVVPAVQQRSRRSVDDDLDAPDLEPLADDAAEVEIEDDLVELDDDHDFGEPDESD